MADQSQRKSENPVPDQHLHTPGGMAQPAADVGRSADGADIASTDQSMNPGSNFGEVEPPPSPDEDEDADPAGGGLPIEPAASAVRRLESELDDLRDRHARLAAEFDNYRKRITRERAELGDRAQAGLAARLLDVLDDVDRLVAGDENTPVAALREALVMIDRKLRKELEAAGLERIDPAGATFDPAEHEAVSIVPPPEPAKDHTVSATFQAGYRFKGSLIRPARVQVFSEGGQA